MNISSPIENIRASIAYTRSVYGFSDEAAEYRRRRGPDKTIEPTEADWKIYWEAVAVAEKIDDNPFIDVDDLAFSEPRPYKVPGEYVETEDEWIERVAELIAASGGNLPDDLDRALSVREAETLMATLGETGVLINGRDAWTRHDGYQTGGLD